MIFFKHQKSYNYIRNLTVNGKPFYKFSLEFNCLSGLDDWSIRAIGYNLKTNNYIELLCPGSFNNFEFDIVNSSSHKVKHYSIIFHITMNKIKVPYMAVWQDSRYKYMELSNYLKKIFKENTINTFIEYTSYNGSYLEGSRLNIMIAETSDLELELINSLKTYDISYLERFDFDDTLQGVEAIYANRHYRKQSFYFEEPRVILKYKELGHNYTIKDYTFGECLISSIVQDPTVLFNTRMIIVFSKYKIEFEFNDLNLIRQKFVKLALINRDIYDFRKQVA